MLWLVAALDFFFEDIVLGFLLNLATAIAELGLPLAAPTGTYAIFAFDFAFVLAVFAFCLNGASAFMELVFELTPPPASATGRENIVVGLCQCRAGHPYSATQC
jgi:hypothetical protein